LVAPRVGAPVHDGQDGFLYADGSHPGAVQLKEPASSGRGEPYLAAGGGLERPTDPSRDQPGFFAVDKESVHALWELKGSPFPGGWETSRETSPMLSPFLSPPVWYTGWERSWGYTRLLLSRGVGKGAGKGERNVIISPSRYF